jgi:hypothetical protein
MLQPDEHAHKKFMDAFLKVIKAPEPEVVNWENYNYSKCNRFLRSLVVIFINIIMLCVCLGSIAAANHYEMESDSQYGTGHCGTFEVTMDQAFSDY